jgi:hypothetical protein
VVECSHDTTEDGDGPSAWRGDTGGFSHTMRMIAAAKQIARWVGVIISLTGVGFAALTYTGFWSHVRGDDLLIAVADRFDLSYAPDASEPVRPDDPAWKPLMRVITEYSRADLRNDKKPEVLARMAAISSAKVEAGGALVAEWTAPTTP